MSLNHLQAPLVATFAVALGFLEMPSVSAAEARPALSARFAQRVAMRGGAGETIVFGPAKEIELRVQVFNEEDADQNVLMKSGFLERIAWRLSRADGSAVELHASWCHGPGVPLRCDDLIDRWLQPGADAVESAVVLTLPAGTFEVGRFIVLADLAHAGALLRGVGGQQWRGKMVSPRAFPLIIREPANQSEHAMLQRVSGAQHFAKGNYSAALDCYERWAEAEPRNPMAINAVGETLFVMTRFAEALNVLQRADALAVLNGHSLVPQNVAAALFALDRDREAELYLRQRYSQSPEAVAQFTVLARNRAERARRK